MPEISAHLLMTRPLAASKRFLADLQDDLPPTLNVILSPLIETCGVPHSVPEQRYAGVIFSSSAAVAHCQLPPAGLAYCVGAQTTRNAEKAGWAAQYVGQDAETLVAALHRNKPATPLLHIRGVHTRGEIAATLSECGSPTLELVVYDQQAQAPSLDAVRALAGDKPVIVPLFSPRTAALFSNVPNKTAPLHLVGMSSAVLDQIGTATAVSRIVADAPDADSMKDALWDVLRRVVADSAPQ